MPFALLFFGLVILVAAYRGNHAELFAQLAKDFSGKDNFFYWIGALILVGIIGYFNPMEKVSRMFLALIILALVLSNKGLVAQLKTAIDESTGPASETVGPTEPNTSTERPGLGDLVTSILKGQLPNPTGVIPGAPGVIRGTPFVYR